MTQAIATDTIFSEDDEVLDVQFPPTDLWSDEPPLESDFHRDQIDLLLRLLKSWWCDRQDFYATGNLTIYYNEQQLKSRDFRGPDFFVVLETDPKKRKSWVVWGEGGKYPNVIVEILSDKTRRVDKGLKKQLYQNTFRTPEYFWFDPVNYEFKGFHLVNSEYEELQPTPDGWLWSQQLDLYLGVHDGTLRFFTVDRQLVPSPEEIAEQERQNAEQERQNAEQERQKAEQAEQRAAQAEQELARLRSQLRAQNPDS